MKSLLKNSDFLRVWGNQVLLQVSINLCNYTALLIIAYTTQSPLKQAWFYVGITIPALLFGIIAGPLVELSEKKRLMVLCDIALIVFFGLYLWVGTNFLAIIAVAFLTASVARFFIPAEAAAIPQIVKPHQLELANTFFLFTLLGSVLVGYIIAAPIIQLGGGLGTSGQSIPFVVASILLLVGLISLVGLRKIQKVELEVSEKSVVKQTTQLFLDVLGELRTNYRVTIPIFLLAFVELNIGVLTVILLEYVRRYLFLPIPMISYVLIIPFIAGLALGALLLPSIRNMLGYKTSIFSSMIGISILYILLSILPLILPGQGNAFVLQGFSSLIAMVAGICIVIISVQSRTLVQRFAPVQMHGRVFSFLDILIALVTPIPVLLLGFFANSVGLLLTLFSFGVVISIAAVCVRYLYRLKVL